MRKISFKNTNGTVISLEDFKNGEVKVIDESSSYDIGLVLNTINIFDVLESKEWEIIIK